MTVSERTSLGYDVARRKDQKSGVSWRVIDVCMFSCHECAECDVVVFQSDMKSLRERVAPCMSPKTSPAYDVAASVKQAI